MAHAFTHYWSDGPHGYKGEGKALDYTAGDDFTKRGVKVGDHVYIVNIFRGELYLIGRFAVAQVLFSDADAEKHFGYQPWSAKEHLIGKPETGTPMRFQRVVPLEIVKCLRLHTIDGVRGLAFVGDTKLDRQTLRGFRRLTEPSAALLDDLLAREP